MNKINTPYFILLFIVLAITNLTVCAQESYLNANSAWIYISSEIEEFYLVVNDDFQNAKIISDESYIQLTEGTHKLRFVTDSINDWVTTVTLVAGDTVKTKVPFDAKHHLPSQSSYRSLKKGHNFQLKGTNQSFFKINGVLVPQSTIDTLLAPGMYEIDLIHGKKRAKRIVVVNPGTTTEFQAVENILHPKDKSIYFIPGYGYLYHRKPLKSMLTVSLMALFATPMINEIGTFRNAKSEFNSYNNLYNKTISSVQAIEYRTLAVEEHTNMKDARKKALLFGTGLVLVYGYSVWDSINIGSSKVMRTRVTTTLATSDIDYSIYPTLVFNYDF